MTAVARAAWDAAWSYLNSREARKWERALLAGVGYAVFAAVRAALGW